MSRNHRCATETAKTETKTVKGAEESYTKTEAHPRTCHSRKMKVAELGASDAAEEEETYTETEDETYTETSKTEVPLRKCYSRNAAEEEGEEAEEAKIHDAEIQYPTEEEDSDIETKEEAEESKI
jgi:hypothetical protein